MSFKPNCRFFFTEKNPSDLKLKIRDPVWKTVPKKDGRMIYLLILLFFKISTKLKHFDQWYVVCWYSLYIYSGCYSEVWICIWLFTRPSHFDTGWVRLCGLQFKTDTDLVDWLLTLNNAGQATKVWNVIFTHGAGCERTRGWQQLRAHGSGYKC